MPEIRRFLYGRILHDSLSSDRTIMPRVAGGHFGEGKNVFFSTPAIGILSPGSSIIDPEGDKFAYQAPTPTALSE
jgi:hypothetical protein